MATDISLEPPTVNLTVYKGDSINLKINLTENGSAYIIPALGGGAGWKASIKKSSDSSFVGALTVAGTAGQSYITVYVPNSVTTTLTDTLTYKYDIQYTWIESSVTYIRTFLKGTITVINDVTLQGDA